MDTTDNLNKRLLEGNDLEYKQFMSAEMPSMMKSKSKFDQKPQLEMEFNINARRPTSFSMRGNLFHTATPFKDMQESVLKASSDKVDWVKKFYKISTLSHNMGNSRDQDIGMYADLEPSGTSISYYQNLTFIV